MKDNMKDFSFSLPSSCVFMVPNEKGLMAGMTMMMTMMSAMMTMKKTATMMMVVVVEFVVAHLELWFE